MPSRQRAGHWPHPGQLAHPGGGWQLPGRQLPGLRRAKHTFAVAGSVWPVATPVPLGAFLAGRWWVPFQERAWVLWRCSGVAPHPRCARCRRWGDVCRRMSGPLRPLGFEPCRSAGSMCWRPLEPSSAGQSLPFSSFRSSSPYALVCFCTLTCFRPCWCCFTRGFRTGG